MDLLRCPDCGQLKEDSWLPVDNSGEPLPGTWVIEPVAICVPCGTQIDREKAERAKDEAGMDNRYKSRPLYLSPEEAVTYHLPDVARPSLGGATSGQQTEPPKTL